MFSAVEIEINSNCNLKCSYCPNSIAERIEKGFMSKALYFDIISQLQEIGFSGRISYDFYNEPLLHPLISEYVAIAKNTLPKSSIEIYTNGTLLTLTKFKQLVVAGVDKFVVTRHENTVDWEFEQTYNLLSDQEKKLVALRDHSALKLSNRGGLLKNIGPRTETTFLPCFIPDHILTITVHGHIVPCFEDFHQHNSMGNLNEKTIIEIWNSEKYIQFRKDLKLGLRHKYKSCDQCNRHEVLF